MLLIVHLPVAEIALLVTKIVTERVKVPLLEAKQSLTCSASLSYGGREGPSIATSIWRFCNGTMQWKFSMVAHNGSAYILYRLSLVIGAPHLGQHAV